MPACYLMSWEPRARRWTKMFRGLRFAISCKQLDVPETKKDSYLQANEWWLSKREEIVSQHSKSPEIQELLPKLRWAHKHDRPDLERELNHEIRQLEQDLERRESDESSPLVIGPDESFGGLLARLTKITATLQKQIDITPVLAKIRDKEVWDERFAADSPSVPASVDDRSVAHQVTLYLANLKDRVDAKQYSHGAYRCQVNELARFVEFLGASTPIDQIDEQKWVAFFQYLLRQIGLGKYSPGYSKRLFRAGQTFVQSLASVKLIPVPANLYDRRLRFKVGLKTIQIFEREEITRLLSPDNREVVRLFVLLGLNCGMTQIDISDLRHDEVDWTNGRLKRRRSKTSDIASTPVVEYVLWKETIDLLVKLRSQDPTRVLLTRTGRPWVSDGETFSDSIRLEFMKLKPSLTFKFLRKTGASTLAAHPEFRAYGAYYLGHSPANIADSHYIRPSQDRFDLAVGFLREQFLTDSL